MKASPVMTFGMVQPRVEGGAIAWDPSAPVRKPKKGDKKPVNTRWMEISVRDNQSRASVHKMVDEWLDDRASGKVP